MDAAGHQEIAGAFGGGFDEGGRLDLQEAIFIEVVSGDLGHLVAEHQVFLQLRTAQIQVTIFQAEHFIGFGAVHDLKGRRFGLAQNTQLGDEHFDVTGGDFFALALPFPNGAHSGDHIFTAQAGSLLENFLIGIITESQLEQAGAIPQICEDQAAQVTLPLDPAADGDGFPNVFRAQSATVVGALKTSHGIHSCSLLLSVVISSL